MLLADVLRKACSKTTCPVKDFMTKGSESRVLLSCSFIHGEGSESNKKAMNKNWRNQNPKPALKIKWDTTKMRHITKETHGQPSEQLFSDKLQLCNLNETKISSPKGNDRSPENKQE